VINLNNKTINFVLGFLLIAMGIAVYSYTKVNDDAKAQLEANGTALLFNANAEKIASFANSNGTMAQAVLNVHAARGINHENADGFGAAARDAGGVSLGIVKESEVPAIMKEYRRLRAEQPPAAAKSARKNSDEDEENDEEPAEESDPDAP
jgi:hypothetical protein